MRFSKAEMLEMEIKKRESKKTVDRLVMDELLEMGFSYNRIGTHYLHESIIFSVSMKVEEFGSTENLCARVREKVTQKYGVGAYRYSTEIATVIEKAFESGNINYLLDTFKGSYDRDKMKVTKNAFIMTLRQIVIEKMRLKDLKNATQLRLIIQGSVENITDYTALKSICDIVLLAGERQIARW